MFLVVSMTKLNNFPRHDFPSNTTPQEAKRLGQFSTRLYFVLLIISLSFLVIYTVVRPQNFTETIEKPSFIIYNQLYQIYKNELKCPCSRATSQYINFVTIESIFHQVRLIYLSLSFYIYPCSRRAKIKILYWISITTIHSCFEKSAYIARERLKFPLRLFILHFILF